MNEKTFVIQNNHIVSFTTLKLGHLTNQDTSLVVTPNTFFCSKGVWLD